MSGSISPLLTTSDQVFIAIWKVACPSQKSKFRIGFLRPLLGKPVVDQFPTKQILSLWNLHSGLLLGIYIRNNICEQKGKKCWEKRSVYVSYHYKISSTNPSRSLEGPSIAYNSALNIYLLTKCKTCSKFSILSTLLATSLFLEIL